MDSLEPYPTCLLFSVDRYSTSLLERCPKMIHVGGIVLCTLRSSSHNRSVRLRFTCMGRRPFQDGQHTCQTVKLFLHQRWFSQLHAYCWDLLSAQTLGILYKGWALTWDVAFLALPLLLKSLRDRLFLYVQGDGTQCTAHLLREFIFLVAISHNR